MSNGHWGALLLALWATGGSAAQPQTTGFQLGAKPQQLLYVDMEVHDVARSRMFYLNVIGLKEIPGSNPAGHPKQTSMLSFSGRFDDSWLSISHADGAGTSGQSRPARLTFKVADVAALVARARAAGGVVTQAPMPAHGIPGSVTATVLDPDGVPVELVQMPG